MKGHYKSTRKFLIDHNNHTKEIVQLNEYLKTFNWMLVHPYLMGASVMALKNLRKNNCDNERKIYDVFIKTFFDLQQTATIIEGYFKKRPQLLPFCQLIDQSVFLCLQRDYAGAINVLLPVVEGSMRHYLINQKGFSNEKIMGKSQLLKTFEYIKKDYLCNVEEMYLSYDYTPQQIKEMLKHERIFIENWTTMIFEYFDNILYMDTRDGNVIDKLNRHTILHGFNADIYYSIENYLKIFNSICFLNYSFSLTDPTAKSLADVEGDEVNYKWKAFEKIREISKTTAKIKLSVYEKYSNFDTETLKIDSNYNVFDKYFSRHPKFKIEKKLQIIDDLFAQKKSIVKRALINFKNYLTS